MLLIYSMDIVQVFAILRVRTPRHGDTEGEDIGAVVSSSMI